MRLEIAWKFLTRIYFCICIDILDTCLKRMRIQMFWTPVRKKNAYPDVLDTCSKKEYVSGCSGYMFEKWIGIRLFWIPVRKKNTYRPYYICHELPWKMNSIAIYIRGTGRGTEYKKSCAFNKYLGLEYEAFEHWINPLNNEWIEASMISHSMNLNRLKYKPKLRLAIGIDINVMKVA
jgi:hypothetical protein